MDNFDDIQAAAENEDDWYDPPQNEGELNDLLQSLNRDDDQEFNVEHSGMETFQTNLDQILDEMKTSIVTEEYLEMFEQTVQNDMLLVGSISAEQVQLHEKTLKEAKLKQQQVQALAKQKREEMLTILTEQTKQRLMLQVKEQHKTLAQKEALVRQQEKLLQKNMQKAFNQSENDLLRVLEQRKAEIRAFYGNLEHADNQYGGSKGRRWKVEWTKTPQPVQVTINCIRGLRDKAPKGQYVVMISLYDQLGGHPLKWSKLYGQQWSGSTLPVYHPGRHNSHEVAVQQSVFTVLPSQWQLNPGMVLMFELFLLRGSMSPVDRVVAWGCFPICNREFEIIRGSYKLPLLRGHLDERITKHSTIERLISSDIDHWIANLYIEVTRLPRYLQGQKEYEVELQFTSALLSFPDRIHNAEDAVDGEKLPDVSTDRDSASLSDDAKSLTSMMRMKKSAAMTSTDKSRAMTSTETAMTSTDVAMTTTDSFVVKTTADDVTNDEEKTKENGGKVTPKPKLTHLEKLEKHRVSVKASATLSKMRTVGDKTAEFVGRMLMAEANLAQWKTPVFWTGFLITVVLWFARTYIHYCGQWLFLQMLGLPVSSFVFYPYTVDFNYQADLLSTAEEIGVVVLGPIFNILIQILMILIFWMFQALLGELPLVISKIILLFSMWTILDPVMILVVDAILGRWKNDPVQPIGDAFKLYWHFFRLEGSGVVGVPLTIFLYGVVIFCSLVITYIYFLKLHNNGRIQDVFHRLHGTEEDFFLPFDLELSHQELGFVVDKAEKWRGQDGERRKVSVYDYIWDEESDEDGGSTREITRHISIHTLHLDGLRELYRHFLVLPGGAIIEVFDELKIPSAPDVETALLTHGKHRDHN